MSTAYDTGSVTGVTAPAPVVDDSSAPPPAAVREEAAAQVGAYFRAFGLDDAGCLQRLTEQILQRLAAKPVAPETVIQAAIEEAQHRLDDWLAQLLELPDNPPREQLAAARAALRFHQGLADWPEALLQKTIPAPLRCTLKAAVMSSVPPPRERAMVPQPITFWHPLTGPVKALLKFIRRLYRR
ncbi:MAG: hypothetical protein U1F76_24840 [Candidatus Competibacteraceae bacterium]